ncbi:NAD-dependent epimerase/dehydratase family protein [Cryobacterium lyxosi]|uniref:NAD-dependent epimerase/dehydratase family protein n=1 Tax=Cryobacterium lyxosi TaxID=1259228 RepID=A0A4V3IPK0_9MICO|nr:NAD-dependent epimerase/dehydratase family protein [Cryobacterium lyxosi]TFD29197.1 NAD-dependent epimerase/dehydratase family protein [Cryobacterium lyxosi]
MKIFVTGANGFVGRHTCTHLLDRGHDVTAGVRTAGSAPLGTEECLVGDLGPASDWNKDLSGHDAIVHLAARVHVMNDTAKDPLAEFRRVNTFGTVALAQAASSQGVPRFVFLSSIKVNGEKTDGRPFTAKDSPDPQDSYGVSKHEAEVALRSVERETDLQVVVVRTPLVYGPGVGGNFVKTLSLARSGIPLPLRSLRNSRTLCSVWNLVELLEKCASDEAAAGALVLAGDLTSPSTGGLVREISRAMGKRSRNFSFPPALLGLAGRATGKSAIIRRLTQSLEVTAGSSSTAFTWHPSERFEDSIKRTVDWYLGDVAAPDSSSRI